MCKNITIFSHIKLKSSYNIQPHSVVSSDFSSAIKYLKTWVHIVYLNIILCLIKCNKINFNFKTFKLIDSCKCYGHLYNDYETQKYQNVIVILLYISITGDEHGGTPCTLQHVERYSHPDLRGYRVIGLA